MSDDLTRFTIGRIEDVGGDPPLVCDDCGDVLCTVEADDSMSVLVSMCTDHVCGEER